jgi:hypothetical protein
MGTFLYLGKSVISSGEGVLVYWLGFNINGGWMNGSLRWAYPSMRTCDILLYLLAFFNIEAMMLISNYYILFKHVNKWIN